MQVYGTFEKPPMEEDSNNTSPPEVAADQTECSYGWGSVRPKWLQMFNTPRWLLFFMCAAALAQGMVVNGFVSISISTIERRFRMNSKQTGTIAGMYDIAVTLMLIPVCQYGGKGNKARWLGYGLIIMAAGSFLYSLPHFLVDVYDFADSDGIDVPICRANETFLGSTEDCGQSSDLSLFFYMFIGAQLLHGLGASPMYTIGITYLDESVSQKMSAVYIAIYYMFAVIGPAIGYVVGGFLLGVNGEIGRIDTNTVQMTPANTQWYGAWWIGPIITGILAVIIAIPILGYPTELPGTKERKEKDVVETYGGSNVKADQPGFGKNLRDLPKSFKILLFNPTYVFMTLTDTMDGFLLSGFVAFAPKYVENQFLISAGLASQLAGGIVVMAGAAGTIAGGWLIKKFKLTCSGIMKLALLAIILALACCFGMLARCPNAQFAGVTAIYGDDRDVDLPRLDFACNTACNCSESTYRPVCGADHVMYYSSCHAGCTATSNVSMYSSCSCVEQRLSETNTSTDSGGGGSTILEPTAMGGKCSTDCWMLPVFLTFFAMISLFMMVASIPTQAAVLRCVAFSQRSIAVGLQWLVVRILGTIPGPIVFGAVIDGTCLLWQEKCGAQANCRIYDNENLSIRFLIMALVVKSLAGLFCYIALKAYRSGPDADAGSDSNSLDNSRSTDKK